MDQCFIEEDILKGIAGFLYLEYKDSMTKDKRDTLCSSLLLYIKTARQLRNENHAIEIVGG
jgi:hypothetical protein